MNKIIVTLLATLGAASLAQAQPIAGVLERGPTHSALLPVTASGTGYAFANQSAAGKAVLGNCLPGLYCKVERAVTRDLQDASALRFSSTPGRWLEVTHTRSVGMESFPNGSEASVKTRHGVLAVNEEDKTLLFKGRRVLPGVEGNTFLNIVARYELGRNDVVLLQNIGGTACPVLFRLVTVAPDGISTSPEFGTCSENVYAALSPDGITVAMTGFAGPFESAAAQRKAGMTKVVYRLQGGQLTQDGKVVRPS